MLKIEKIIHQHWELLLKTVLISIFILSLIPIVIVGLYARPSLDDYSFSALSSFSPSLGTPLQHYISRSVRYAVANGNIIDVLSAIGRTVFDNYFAWQGTFSAIALFSIPPSVIFGANAYPLTLLFTIFALIATTIFLCRLILKKHSSKNWLLLCLIILTCSIQWIPHIAQGFFWYNGAVFYTFFYSLMLLNLTLMIKLFKSGTVPYHKVALIAALNFFIGGGNYVTALLNTEIGVLLSIYVLYKNKSNIKGTLKKWLPFTIFTTASFTGLIISALAPGNAVRGGMFGITFSFSSVIRTIFLSIEKAIYDIINWTSPPIILLLIVTTPIMWHILRNIPIRFKYPALVTLLTFLLFASQNAPPIFAMNYAGDPKLRNIIYFSYVWFIFGNAMYWLGWLSKKVKIYSSYATLQIILLCACVWGILFITFGLGIRWSPINRTIVIERRNAPTTVLTLRDFLSGSPQKFLEEHRLRQKILEESNSPTVMVNSFSTMPLTLVPFLPYHLESGYVATELTHSYTHWVNRSIAAYYGVDFIVGMPPERTVGELNLHQLRFGDRNATVKSYRILDMHFFRIRDLAYLLYDVFNVKFYEGQFLIHANQKYIPIGNEGSLTLPADWRQPAYLYSNGLIIDEIARNVPGYRIQNEIFFRSDMFRWLGVRTINRNGILYFYRIE